MSVQDHIENILNAEGQECLDAWYVAINEHPQNAIEIPGCSEFCLIVFGKSKEMSEIFLSAGAQCNLLPPFGGARSSRQRRSCPPTP